jgi:CHAT domain-containing protein
MDELISRFHTPLHDEERSVALFERLIPDQLKSRFGEQRGLILTVDKQSARYPWELMAGRAPDAVSPISVRQQMIRRFPHSEFRAETTTVYGKDVLVIGDTQTRLAELPGAQEEASAVAEVMKTGGLNVVQLIRSDAATAISKLFSGFYRMIHLACHWVDTPQNPSGSGIPLSDNVYMTAAKFAKLRAIPEVIFINCDSPGRIDSNSQLSQAESLSKTVTIVEEFVNMGVKAVIAAAWAIDDDAASTFSTTFYQRLISGQTLGSAVLDARRAAYDRHPQSNAWGAYQCYGNPNFIPFRQS